MTQIGMMLAIMALGVPVSAQWPAKTPGIPRTADGKPRLSAPPPRRPDGKPDFSGLWEHLNARTSAYYLKDIPFPWQPSAKALFEERKANNQKENPEGQCLPRGLPKADAFDIHKIVQTPELIVILYEYGTTFRQIFIDGRALPTDANPKPWTTELHPELVPDTELIEFVCNENERDARHLVGK